MPRHKGEMPRIDLIRGDPPASYCFALLFQRAKGGSSQERIIYYQFHSPFWMWVVANMEQWGIETPWKEEGHLPGVLYPVSWRDGIPFFIPFKEPWHDKKEKRRM